jgi:hypothetical protein
VTRLLHTRILSGPPARQDSLTSAGTILGEMVSWTLCDFALDGFQG